MHTFLWAQVIHVKYWLYDLRTLVQCHLQVQETKATYALDKGHMDNIKKGHNYRDMNRLC